MPNRYDFQKIDQNLLIFNADTGHGSDGKIKSAESSWLGRTVFLKIGNGESIELNRGSLIDFLQSQGCEVDKGYLGGRLGGSDDETIQNAFDEKFKGKTISKIDDSFDSYTSKLRSKAKEFALNLNEALKNRNAVYLMGRGRHFKNGSQTLQKIASALIAFSDTGHFNSENSAGHFNLKTNKLYTYAEILNEILDAKDNSPGGPRTLKDLEEYQNDKTLTKEELSILNENIKSMKEALELCKRIQSVSPEIAPNVEEFEKIVNSETEKRGSNTVAIQKTFDEVVSDKVKQVSSSSDDLHILKKEAKKLADSLDAVFKSREHPLGFYRNGAPSVANLISALTVFSKTGDFNSKIETKNASGQGSSIQPTTVKDTLLLILRKDDDGYYIHGGIREIVDAINKEEYYTSATDKREKKENQKLVTELEKIIKFVESIPSLKIQAEQTKTPSLPEESTTLHLKKARTPIVFQPSSSVLPQLKNEARKLATSLDDVFKSREHPLGFYRNGAPSVANLISALTVFSKTGDFNSKIETKNASGQGSSIQPTTVKDTLLLILRKDDDGYYIHGGIREIVDAINKEEYYTSATDKREKKENQKLVTELEKIIKFVESIPVE